LQEAGVVVQRLVAMLVLAETVVVVMEGGIIPPRMEAVTLEAEAVALLILNLPFTLPPAVVVV